MNDVLLQIIITGGSILTLIVASYFGIKKLQANTDVKIQQAIADRDSQIKLDDAVFLRSQIFTKEEWQVLSDKKDKEHAEEMRQIHEFYKDKISQITQTLSLNHSIETGKLAADMTRLQEENAKLTKRVTEQDEIIKDLQEQITKNKP